MMNTQQSPQSPSQTSAPSTGYDTHLERFAAPISQAGPHQPTYDPSKPYSAQSPYALRQPILAASLCHIPFDHWSNKALAAGARDLGLAPEYGMLAFPEGPLEALQLYNTHLNDALKTQLASTDLSDRPFRARIAFAVKSRLLLAGKEREIERQALHFLSQPFHMPAAIRLSWDIADIIWSSLNDKSTDHNWYTKRATLAAVYSTCFLYWLNDESSEQTDSWAFLNREIEAVMQFEKLKGRLRDLQKKRPKITDILSRLRYGKI